MSKGKKKHRTCVSCGCDIWSTGFNNPVEKTFCLPCTYAKRTGSKNPWWKGGVYKKDEYIYVHLPAHPKARSNGYVKRANVVWEQNTGHFPDWSNCEELHHIDGDKLNDEFSNLQLMTHGEHSRLHNNQSDYKNRSGKNHYSHKDWWPAKKR